MLTLDGFHADALEDKTLGHGLFTAAIVEGMNGAADADGDKRVMTGDLGAFVQSWVKARAAQQNHLQEPEFYRGKDAPDYLLARVK